MFRLIMRVLSKELLLFVLKLSECKEVFFDSEELFDLKRKQKNIKVSL